MRASHYSPIAEYELPSLEDFFAAVPSDHAINAAKEHVMTVILEEFPQAGGRVIVRASDAAERLRVRGHTLAASLFAVRKSVLEGELFALPTIPPIDGDWTPWNNVNLFLTSEWPSDLSGDSIQTGSCGLLVDPAQRVVRRQGFSEHVDFGNKGVSWFIFKTVFDAKGSDIDMARFETSYVGSWDARFSAVNSLNKLIQRLGVKVENWKLHDL